MALRTTDPRTAVHPDVDELAQLLRPFWPQMSADLLVSGVPVCEGDPEPEPAKPDPEPSKPDPDPEPSKVDPDDDWKAKSRKNENRAKKAEREAEELRKQLEDREAANKSDHEKAIEAARKEAREEALSEAEKDRRTDRLEVAVTRSAARGVTVGEGDDAKTLRFVDPEDALLRIERKIRSGDIDADDIFDDEGKVKADALEEALVELAQRNTHLVHNGDGKPAPVGVSPARRGEPAQSDLEAMTPEQHAERKYGKRT